MKDHQQKIWLWALLAVLALVLGVLLWKSIDTASPESAISGIPSQSTAKTPTQASATAHTQSGAAPSTAVHSNTQPSGEPDGSHDIASPSTPTQPTPSEEGSVSSSASYQPPDATASTIEPTIDTTSLDEYGLVLETIGSYAGIYMEDGTNEVVSGVAMVVLTNHSEDTIQYGELTIFDGERELNFSLSTLPPNESIVLLELARQEYRASDYYSAELSSVALFSQPLSLQEDKLEYQILDGVINVTNISGEDISGDIVIYYKNSAPDLLYGGITYRIRLQGGLKSGEIRQIMANHFSDSGSRLMFTTIG